VLKKGSVRMSFFGKIFGSGKKGDKAPTTGEAIQKLRETEEMLMKKQDFLEKKIEQELDVARKNAKTNKRAALQVNLLSTKSFISVLRVRII
jgi:charged multivesicular body protein 4